MLKHLSFALLERFRNRCVKRHVITKVTCYTEISFKVSQGCRELQIGDSLDLVFCGHETKTVDVLTKEAYRREADKCLLWLNRDSLVLEGKKDLSQIGDMVVESLRENYDVIDIGSCEVSI
jgi:hypothetical protein